MVCQTPDGQRRLTDGVTKWHYVERRMAHWRGRYILMVYARPVFHPFTVAVSRGFCHE